MIQRNFNRAAVLIPLLVLFMLFQASYYVVDETEQVIITQFGEPLEPAITDAGLHFKVPFIQKANYFDKRFLEWDGDPNQVPTKDKRFIWVNTYARWRISDPLLFFQRFRDERSAQTRLDDILDGETRSAVARQDLVEVVRNANRDAAAIAMDGDEETGILQQIETGREAITREILGRAQPPLADLGIELLDIRLKRINYVDEVQKDVFDRMIAERKRIAQRYRSEGEGEAARIMGERERDLAKIQSEAYRKAQAVRGEADAKATGIFANAYNRDPSLYAFLKSLETYEKTADPNSALILTTNSDLLKGLKRIP